MLRERGVAFGKLIFRRLDVGDELIFELEATDPRGRDLVWKMYSLPENGVSMMVDTWPPLGEATGSRVRIGWKVTEHEVGEWRQVVCTVANAGKYHRVRSWDDGCMFYYAINPPRHP